MDNVRALSAERERPPIERDDDLAVAARTDPDAFGMLYERHRLAVFRYVRTRTRSDDDAGELTAIVFERALQAIPRYRPAGGGFVAWLIRIARNAAVDTHRRPAPVPLVADLSEAASIGGPEEHLLAIEARTSLLAAVSGLPPLQREAIVLRYAAGLTAREIGEVLGKSDQATQKLLSRALASIRETYRVDI
jgi:RNA polymerase sigma-70 factor (ECF subfamily)